MNWNELELPDNPYFKDDDVLIYHADCRDILPLIPDKSIDLVLTDPPYGISFMGKEWDKALPNIQIWKECLRVLKDGAFAFVMSIPRADCLSRMIINLEDAGFKVGFTPIFWAYASGFPKAQNIGKMVDKKPYRKERLALKAFLGNAIKINGKTRKQIDSECGFTACSYTRVNFRKDDGWGEALPDTGKWFKMKEVIRFDDTWDWLIKENERQLMGRHKSGIAHAFGENGWGMGTDVVADTIGKHPLEGSYGGFQPKPAIEVIIVAMKPLSEKTFVDQALKNRKGITWLDDGRIPLSNIEPNATWRASPSKDNQNKYTSFKTGSFGEQNPQGRFPANLLVSDDVLNDGRIIFSKSNLMQPDPPKDNRGTWQMSPRKEARIRGVDDSGSFSRYFDLDKWWCQRIEKLPMAIQKTYPFLVVPKASKSEKNKGLDNNITVKYNISNGGILCKDEIMVAVQLLPKVISGLTAHWNKDEFGESIMVQFRRDISSTILTETSKIIELKTLPSLMHSLTNEYIQDVSGSMENGGSLAENVERLKEYLLTITNGNRELALGVSRVVLKMLLKISVRENWHENYNFHATVKPLKLMSYLITLGSREGDIILDPFGGSGTTALASKLLNRHCLMFEIEEKYCEITAKRCSQSVMSLNI